MMYRDFWRKLTAIYDEQEARAIASLVYEERFGLNRTDICMGEDARMSEEQNGEAERILGRLLLNEPVQYVLGYAYFGESRYVVKPGVLIPRPETAALVAWMVADMADEKRLLDCCCGSGCIALEMKGAFPAMQVSAYDISDVAIEVSRENARLLGRDINVFAMDALNPAPATEKYDVIVSNPPYVCDHERAGMRRNVLDYEPLTALFVPDEDPIKFYTAIARYATQALTDGGRLYFEINPLFVDDMKVMLSGLGFVDVTVNTDCGYENRLMRAAIKR